MSKIKNIRSFSLTIIIAATLFSSCTIQKRRYTRDYHVNISLHKPSSGHLAFTDTVQQISIDEPLAGIDPINFLEPKKMDSLIFCDTTETIHETKLHTDQLTISKDNTTQIITTTNALKTNSKMNTKNTNNSNSKRNLAVLIGIALLLMAILAAFSATAISGMFVLGNSSLTALNVVNHFSNFTAAIMAWFGILLLDIFVSVGIYKYYKKEHPKQASITGFLRLIYSLFLGFSIFQLLKVTVATPALSIYSALNTFNRIWSWGLIAFGLHLIALGILFNNEGGKKWVNYTIKTLLMLAGLGYIIINVGILMSPNPIAFKALLQSIFLIPMIFGEVFFALWMLVKGGKKLQNTAKKNA